MKTQTAIIVLATVLLTGCATLTESPMTSIALSFSNGENGSCTLTNKRAAEFQNKTRVPATVMVRKSDDALIYRCKTASGKKASGAIPSRMGGKIVASAVFLDFGIVDSVTDHHREYPPVFVIPVGDEYQSEILAESDSNRAISNTNAPLKSVSWTSVSFHDYGGYVGQFLWLESSSTGRHSMGRFGIAISPCDDRLWLEHWAKRGRKALPFDDNYAWVAVDFGEPRGAILSGKRKFENDAHAGVGIDIVGAHPQYTDHSYIHVGLKLRGRDVVLPFSLSRVPEHLHKFDCS